LSQKDDEEGSDKIVHALDVARRRVTNGPNEENAFKDILDDLNEENE
jgi:hypothetical protein